MDIQVRRPSPQPPSPQPPQPPVSPQPQQSQYQQPIPPSQFQQPQSVGPRPASQMGAKPQLTPVEKQGGSRVFGYIITVILAALVGGGSVYFAMSSANDKEALELRGQITTLRGQLETLQAAVTPSPATSVTPTPNASTTPAPSVMEIDATKAKTGDKFGSMTIKSIAAYDASKGSLSNTNAKIVLTGETTLTGNFEYATTGSNKDKVCLSSLDAASKAKLPVITGSSRTTQFCLTNQDIAGTQFGVKGSTGEATVTVNNFTINQLNNTLTDSADLVKLVSKK